MKQIIEWLANHPEVKLQIMVRHGIILFVLGFVDSEKVIRQRMVMRDLEMVKEDKEFIELFDYMGKRLSGK